MASDIPPGWHRHPNGGGLVQNTAHVEDTAYVGPLARVYGNAQVGGNAWIYGNAQVFGNARVGDDAWHESPPQMRIGRWYGHMREVDVVAIGCETSPVDADLHAWVKYLARRHGATPAEVLAARCFVDYVKEWRETFVEVEYVDGEGVSDGE